MTTYVNEASTCTVRARFRDVNHQLVTPSTVRYLVKDVSNNRIVKDWTSVTPGSEISIEISGVDNEMYAYRQRPFEHRVVTVQANADEVTQRTDEVEYYIRNLHGIDEND